MSSEWNEGHFQRTLELIESIFYPQILPKQKHTSDSQFQSFIEKMFGQNICGSIILENNTISETLIFNSVIIGKWAKIWNTLSEND